MIRVLLADDHQIVRQGVAALLDSEDDIKVVGGAGSGEQALSMLTRLKPDVLVTDIEMPAFSGIRLCSEVRKRGLSAGCVVLSMHCAEEYVNSAFRAGARGFVAKDHSVDHLARAIREVAKGRRYLSPHLPLSLSQLPEPE